MQEIAAVAPGETGSRPAPYTDRRALSEAWYRALFDSRSPASAAGKVACARAEDAGDAARSQRRLDGSHLRADEASRAAPRKLARMRLLRAAFTSAGRARAAKPPSVAPVRPAWRDAAWRRTLCRTLLPGGHAVDLLVQQRGAMLRLVAIYDGRSASRVTAALVRARAALLQRGLRVELDARERGRVEVDAREKGAS